MKILWVTKKYFDVDIDIITWIETTKYMLDMGHDVTLIGTYHNKRKDFGLKNKFILMPPGFTKPKWLSYLSKLLIASGLVCYKTLVNKPDVIISDPNTVFSLVPIRLMRILKITNTKVITDLRTLPDESGTKREKVLGKLLNFIFKHFNVFFDGLTVITPGMKEKIQKEYALPLEIGIWTSGVDLTHFSKENTKPIANLELEALRKKFVVIFHGALSEKRGIENVIHAMSRIKSKGYKDIIFLILSFGKLKDRYARLASSKGLDDCVLIQDAVPYCDIPSYLELADVGILPYYDVDYWNTSSPLKLLEYLAMEKPVIVSDIRAFRDVLNDSPCANYIRENDPQSITEAIEYSYKNRANLPHWGQQGRKIVAEKYTWKHCAENLINYLISMQ